MNQLMESPCDLKEWLLYFLIKNSLSIKSNKNTDLLINKHRFESLLAYIASYGLLNYGVLDHGVITQLASHEGQVSFYDKFESEIDQFFNSKRKIFQSMAELLMSGGLKAYKIDLALNQIAKDFQSNPGSYKAFLKKMEVKNA